MHRKPSLDVNVEEWLIHLCRHTPPGETCLAERRLCFGLRVVDRERCSATSKERDLPCLDVQSRDDSGEEDDADADEEEWQYQGELDGCLTGFGVVTQVVQCAK